MGHPVGFEPDFVGAVTVGERGQVVIPAEARKRFGIAPGEKLLLFHHPGLHSLVLLKVEQFTAMAEHVKKVRALLEEQGGVVEAEHE
jgi:AbrB family looped-hinge helix DNA binding protein